MRGGLKPLKAQSPRYLEAYHRIDFVRARSAWKRGWLVCQYVDESNRGCGQAFLLDQTPDRIRIGYSFYGVDRPPGATSFAVAASETNRLYVLCPRCKARKAVLIFAGEWACTKCHGLRHRSELLPEGVTEQERFEKLRLEIEQGDLQGSERHLGRSGLRSSRRHGQTRPVNTAPRATFTAH